MSAPEDERRETPLARKLAATIRASGPITVADYVRACLLDTEHGYYRTQAAIGAGADFITAPEISQVFGELVGLWSGVAWSSMQAAGPLTLVELGPGRGTLMRDALRALRAVRRFGAPAVHLVEINPHLRALQEAGLDGAASAAWHTSLETVPTAPAVVIGNEYLDTFPLRQWVRAGVKGETWVERRVGLDAAGALAFSEAPGTAVREAHDFDPLLVELSRRATAAPIAALFVDYGHEGGGEGDTLQAVRRHRTEHPLAAPGEADLTAHVDFAALARTAQAHGLAVDGPVPQAEFLSRLGIVERASRLMAASPANASAVEAGVLRLIAPTGMGTLFKVVGLRGAGTPPLPGFDA